MPQSAFEIQDTLPNYIQLFQYVPNRRSREGCNAAAVRHPGDLPPYLFLGILDETTFRISSAGWSARWQGKENDTYLDATFKADEMRYEFHQVWQGVDGGFGFCSSSGPPEEAVMKCPFYVQFPPSWESAAKTQLERKYQLTYVEESKRVVRSFFIPDGFFCTIAAPVAVSDMRKTKHLLEEIIARSPLSYPVSMAARRIVQVVNYPEGKAPAWTTEPMTVFNQSLLEAGLLPWELPVRETAKDGSAAWTLRREIYFLFINLPFAGITDLLGRIAHESGPVRTLAGPQLRFEWWPIVMHAGLEVQVESISCFDRDRTTRCFLSFVRSGQGFYLPSTEEIDADPARTASLLDRAEEISCRVTEVARNLIDRMLARAHNEPDHAEDRVKVVETQDTSPPDQIAPFSEGMSRQKALQNFRSNVNCANTIFSTDHWLEPNLAALGKLLSDPISTDQAQALDDVLRGRHFMKDILDWLKSPHVPWADYFEDLNTQQKQKAALEREKRTAWGEAQRRKWTGSPLSELCSHSVGTMVRGHALAGAGVPGCAREFPTFLAWWCAVGKSTSGESSEWMRISGPWATLGRVELISDAEWAALDPTERDQLTKWIDSLGLILYD